MNLDRKSVARLLNGRVTAKDEIEASLPGSSFCFTVRLDPRAKDGFFVLGLRGIEREAAHEHVHSRLSSLLDEAEA